jgi:hypothetical protein
MSGGGTQVSTTNVEPWAEQKGYLTGGFEQAQKVFDQGAPEYYPGETLAGFDPAQTAAQQATLGYGAKSGGTTGRCRTKPATRAEWSDRP